MVDGMCQGEEGQEIDWDKHSLGQQWRLPIGNDDTAPQEINRSAAPGSRQQQ